MMLGCTFLWTVSLATGAEGVVVEYGCVLGECRRYVSRGIERTSDSQIKPNQIDTRKICEACKYLSQRDNEQNSV